MRLEELLDGLRADDAAGARSRTGWLRRQAMESATVLGTLLDLAEHGLPVAIGCAGGRRVDGTVRALGADVVVVEERGGGFALVRVAAIALIRPAPESSAGPASGDRVPTLAGAFVDVLASLAGERPEVALALVSGDGVAGELVAVGSDVLSVRVAAGAGGIAYVPAASVSSARLRSG